MLYRAACSQEAQLTDSSSHLLTVYCSVSLGSSSILGRSDRLTLEEARPAGKLDSSKCTLGLQENIVEHTSLGVHR